MDYERIHKPISLQSGGLSPSKLRGILLGVEKKRKEEEQPEIRSSLRAEPVQEFEERRASEVDSCKEVEFSSSAEFSSSNKSKTRSQEDSSLDSDGVSSSGFEFQRADRAAVNRVSVPAGYVPPLLKPAPSKWDDAQKWISSPTSNRGGSKGGGQVKKGHFGYGSRQGLVKFVVDEVDTKGMDGKQAEIKTMNSFDGRFVIPDSRAKTAVDSAVNPGRHELSSASIQGATIVTTPALAIKAVSMRDMGTEMTPIASQEQSRTGTPAKAISPLRSPASSQAQSPKRVGPVPLPSETSGSCENTGDKELCEKELKKKIRRDIMVLGQQLGKTNIAAWASKDEEEANASTSHETVSEDRPAKSSTEARAVAWEEAEKAKYLARFKQEEIQIKAWENHQKAKTEAELRKIEVKVERMRSEAQEKLMNQLAATRHKAEEMRAAAEARHSHEAGKTAQQAESIRKTGRTPSCFCWSCCS